LKDGLFDIGQLAISTAIRAARFFAQSRSKNALFAKSSQTATPLN
jgi:hypothetical protein